MNETQIPFGLVSMVKSRRVVLPLKAVKCAFSVVGGVAEVTVTQVFLQENREALNCLYQFPLPADAAVYDCEAFINDRVIRAKVEEREAARELVKRKQAEGFRTLLVEEERENLFTLSLGNLQPEDLVEVRLAYIQPLRRLAGRLAVEIPFCPGVRYIPGRPLLRSNRGKGVVDDTDQVPDASRISPVRMDKSHPDVAFVEVDGLLEAGYVLEGSVVSPSHQIATRSEDGQMRIRLNDQAAVPDRSFVVRWEEKPADAPTPRAWIQRKGEERYALIEIRAPENAGGMVVTPQDVYFLVDRSGSMEGEKWRKAVEALESCVGVMAPDDRVMITLFDSGFRDFSEAPMSPAELLADAAFRQLARLGAGGGTEMGPALSHVLDLIPAHSAGRRTNLVLITDAQVGNERAILGILRRAPALPVHCFGIDNALNDALLQALTRQQGGSFHSLNPRDDVRAAVTALGRTLRAPILLDVRLSEGWETAEHRIPDLYAGQVQYACVRRMGESDVTLTARDSAGSPVVIHFKAAESTSAAPYLHWCKSRLQRLLAEDERSGAAVGLSKESNLICERTAFVTWDEQEQVAVAGQELVQPSCELSERSNFDVLAHPRLSLGRGLINEAVGSQFLPELAARKSCHAADDAVEWWRSALLKLGNRIREPDLSRRITAFAHRKLRFDAGHQPWRLAAIERMVEQLGRLATELEQVMNGFDSTRKQLEKVREEAAASVSRAFAAVDGLVRRLETGSSGGDWGSDAAEALRLEVSAALERLIELVKQFAELHSRKREIKEGIEDRLRVIGKECLPEPEERKV